MNGNVNRKTGFKIVILIVAAAMALSVTMVSCGSGGESVVKETAVGESAAATDQAEEKETDEVSEAEGNSDAAKTEKSSAYTQKPTESAYKDSQGGKSQQTKSKTEQQTKETRSKTTQTSQATKPKATKQTQAAKPKPTQHTQATESKQDVCYITIEGYCSSKEIELQGGDTAYSILTRSGATISGSGSYIKGINGKFEFDEGPTSGWVYSVNGTRPTVGCGSYTVKAGDIINWYYVTGF